MCVAEDADVLQACAVARCHAFCRLYSRPVSTEWEVRRLISLLIEQRGPVLKAYWSNRRFLLSPPCSRQAVAEHQLMHDRGRNIQSLKRLIWLSSAIEGLHTAQTQSAAFNPTKVLNLALNPALVSAAGSPQPSRVQSLLRDFFNNPYLIQLPDRKP